MVPAVGVTPGSCISILRQTAAERPLHANRRRDHTPFRASAGVQKNAWSAMICGGWRRMRASQSALRGGDQRAGG